jgi:hypothetical protein
MRVYLTLSLSKGEPARPYTNDPVLTAPSRS